jgi:hypothetical protein
MLKITKTYKSNENRCKYLSISQNSILTRSFITTKNVNRLTEKYAVAIETGNALG